MPSLDTIPSWALVLVAVVALVAGNRELVWGWLRAAWGWVRPAPPSPIPTPDLPDNADLLAKLILLRQQALDEGHADAAELLGQAIAKVLDL